MSRQVRIGKIKIGGGNPVAIQSMANIKTSKIADVIRQIEDLTNLGCDIIRVSVKDDDDVSAHKKTYNDSACRRYPFQL